MIKRTRITNGELTLAERATLALAFGMCIWGIIIGSQT